MKTLKLFNAVIDDNVIKEKPVILNELGIIIERRAAYAVKDIKKYYLNKKLSGDDLNKSFHKSWEKIKNSSRFELLVHQIMHYISTYGSNFEDEIYIPTEQLDLPKDANLVYKVIKAYTHKELTKKCLNLLKSGIALKEETIDDILSLLIDSLNYKFTGEEEIRNKEAIIKLAENYNLFPKNNVEFFRYIIYRSTGKTLLIKNDEIINSIKENIFNPEIYFKQFGLIKLAQIFNRFKPLFLAYKSKCPKTINRISKLSKKYHKPMILNPINKVTHKKLSIDDLYWLENATTYTLFKALNACSTRIAGQTNFIYNIRNGKAWATENILPSENIDIIKHNFETIKLYLKKKINLSNLNVYIPKNIEYSLPTSEKMYIGNVPAGTKIMGENLAVGFYWQNDWGANDIDLSGINVGGKVGWNSSYNQNRDHLMYSGDITNAPNGAVEYLYAKNGLSNPTLVQSNIYDGEKTAGYKIIIGSGDDIDKKYMMNPDNLILEEKTQSVQRQTILGIFMPEKDKLQKFVILNLGLGNAIVSNSNRINDIVTRALMEEWNNYINLEDMLIELGANIVEDKEKSNLDLSLDKLEKDTIINLFK